MAIISKVTDILGREVELYIRVNSAEVSNHGVPSQFLFRGYENEEAFHAGGNFLLEQAVEGVIDVSGNVWAQAYALIKDTGSIDA